MSKDEVKTIAISPKNHQSLIRLGRKDQTFDEILSQILQKFDTKEAATK